MTNELLKELSDQARDYARKHVADCKYYGHYMEYNEEQVQFEKKFAELIVRECANIADTAEPYKSNDLILKHFGVEK